MEITKKARFVTDFYGGTAYLSGDKVVKNWIESQQDRLLNPRFRELKDAIGNESKLEEILSVFNTDKESRPIIGDWMLLECSINAQKMAGTWAKYKVPKDIWRNSVRFSPVHINVSHNGKPISAPDGVEVYSVSLKDGRSFFKAYQFIRASSKFGFTVNFPEDLCVKPDGKGKDKIFVADVDKTVECVNSVLDKMGMIGLGAYRLRFGKFEYI